MCCYVYIAIEFHYGALYFCTLPLLHYFEYLVRQGSLYPGATVIIVCFWRVFGKAEFTPTVPSSFPLVLPFLSSASKFQINDSRASNHRQYDRQTATSKMTPITYI